MFINGVTLRDKLYKKELCLGTWVFIPSPDIIEIIGLAGFDFVVIDMEHSAITLQDAVSMMRAAESRGVSPLIRVPCMDETFIKRALDSGAHGIQLPHVETDKELAEAIHYTKYYPHGNRGMATTTRGGGYTLKNIKEHTVRDNQSIMVIASVESKEGLDNLEEIIKVPGVDVIYIGPYDLSQSLGIPGQVDDPEVLSTMEWAISKIRNGGKFAGSFAENTSRARQLKGMGVTYLSCEADGSLIHTAYENIRREILEKEDTRRI